MGTQHSCLMTWSEEDILEVRIVNSAAWSTSEVDRSLFAPLTPNDMQELFAIQRSATVVDPSASEDARSSLVPSPFLVWLSLHVHHQTDIKVAFICDPSVHLAELLRSDDDVSFAYPQASFRPSSKRSACSLALTTIACGLAVSGSIHAPHCPPWRRSLSFAFTSLDVSVNGLTDSDCVWIAQDVVDRCERSDQALQQSLVYAARYTASLHQASAPLPHLKTIPERHGHVFSNSICGAHVESIALGGARLSTVGLSRFLRTLLQLHPSGTDLLCTSLQWVDLRGPHTDTSNTSLRLVDDACSRLSDALGRAPPQIVLRDDGATYEVPPSLSITRQEAADTLALPPHQRTPQQPLTTLETDKQTDAGYKHQQKDLGPPLQSSSSLASSSHAVPDAMQKDEDDEEEVDDKDVDTDDSTPDKLDADRTTSLLGATPPLCTVVHHRTLEPAASVLVPRPAETQPTQHHTTPTKLTHHNVPPPPPSVLSLRSVVLPNAACVTPSAPVLTTTPVPVVASHQQRVLSKIPDASRTAQPTPPSTAQPTPSAAAPTLSRACSPNLSNRAASPRATTSTAIATSKVRSDDVVTSEEYHRFVSTAMVAEVEMQECAVRFGVMKRHWESGFLRNVDVLVELVASHNTTPSTVKTDTIVADMRSVTWAMVTLLADVSNAMHAAVRVVTACMQRGPESLLERTAVSLVEAFGTDHAFLAVEEQLAELETAPASAAMPTFVKDVLDTIAAPWPTPKTQCARLVWSALFRGAADHISMQDELVPSMSDKATMRRVMHVIHWLQEARTRLLSETVKWVTGWSERWTALLRRWLVEKEISRRQTVRALNRRASNAFVLRPDEPPPPSTAKTCTIPSSSKHVDAHPSRSPVQGGRRESPRTNPYAHVKSRISTRRPIEPLIDEPRARRPIDMDPEAVVIVSRVPVQPTHLPAPPAMLFEYHHGPSITPPPQIPEGTPTSTPRYEEHQAARPLSPRPTVVSPKESPRPLAVRDTNASALKKIVMLEAKLADLENNNRNSPKQRRREQTKVADPMPRQGPAPACVQWCTPSVKSHTTAAVAHTTTPFSFVVPPASTHGSGSSTLPPKVHLPAPTMVPIAYIPVERSSSTNSLPQPIRDCASTRATIQVARDIIFCPTPSLSRQAPVPQAVPCTRDVISQDVLSYILGDAAVRSTSNATSSSSNTNNFEEHRSTSATSALQYYSRSTSCN